MRRSLLLLPTALLVIAVHVSSAAACLNDRDIIKAEKEFKSTYEPKSAPAETPRYEPEAPLNGKGQLLTFGGGVGTMLLVGAVVLGLRKSREN
jgi:hypothetical protein